jgi:hypothetical protein
MAELHRVEINEKAPSEIEPEEKPSTEEQLQAEADVPQEENERPPWLPEKFSSAEEMAKSYSELEKKMGAGAKEDEAEVEQSETEAENETEQTEENTSEASQVLEEASKEFWSNDGQLSEETYNALEKAGYPKHLVESYAEGMAALAEKQQGELNSLTQGNYEAMVEWANENLPQEELNSINNTITSSDMNMAKLAVQGLYARYQNEVGAKPKLTQGAVNGVSTMPFKSMQELARAQSDPRYKTGDKAYHEEIDRRLSVSNI